MAGVRGHEKEQHSKKKQGLLALSKAKYTLRGPVPPTTKKHRGSSVLRLGYTQNYTQHKVSTTWAYELKGDW